MTDVLVEADEPIAIVEGQPLLALPVDLYIPPDALCVLLSSFAGPLDLLLYLIKKQNLDILDIPIAKITEQYLAYIEILHAHRLELAADYLVMAAMLAEIKARLLLPPVLNEEGEPEEDPRMALVRRLQAYEEMRQASEALDSLPRVDREHFVVTGLSQNVVIEKPLPVVSLQELVAAMAALFKLQKIQASHHVTKEPLSVKDRMHDILTRLSQSETVHFTDCYTKDEGALGVVVALMAVLELARVALIYVSQIDAFSPISIQAIKDG